jgi:hypothetical protein
MKMRKVKKETVVVTIPVSKDDVTASMIMALDDAIEARNAVQDAQERLEETLSALADELDIDADIDADSLPATADRDAVMEIWEYEGVIEDAE